MFGISNKRSRIPRSVALRRPATVWTRLGQMIRNRTLQVRLGITATAILLLVLAVQGWRAPFPYRLGDYLPRGVQSQTTFNRVNERATELARNRAEDLVPLIYKNNPTPLLTLPNELRAALGDVAAAETLDKLDEETRLDFGIADFLPPPDRGVARTEKLREAAERYPAKSAQDRFDKLRQAIVGEADMDMAARRIDEMVEQFGRFIQPLFDTGVIDSKDLQLQRGIAPDKRLLIVGENQEITAGLSVQLPSVRLNDLLNEAGALGKTWNEFPALKKEIQPALYHWLFSRAQPTLTFNQEATRIGQQKAREKVEPVNDTFLEGDKLVGPRQIVAKPETLTLLQDEYDQLENDIGWGSRVLRMAIVFVLIAVLATLNGFYIATNEPKLTREVGRLITYLSAIVITVFVGRLVSFDPLRAEIVPLMTLVLLLGVAYNQFLATLTAFSVALLLTMSTTGRLDQFLVLLSTCSSAIIPLRRVSSRSTLIKVSFISALTYFIVSCGAAVAETQSLTEVFSNTSFLVRCGIGSSFCLVAGYLVTGTLPMVESLFGVVTDMTLLELSDPGHPLLQDLVRLAPGTYNHSVAVASIAENAAEQVGGNGLLVRVGAYFHDIGKMLKPQYFIENLQDGVASRHLQLNPAMSTLIIIGHVKDGVDLAEQYKIPKPIIDFIEQHHGTTLVEYFYREAARQVEGQPDHRTDAEESLFRYPGPKPQTKEAGVLMIVDACESACRTLTEPTPKRIESLVGSIVMRRLLDDQFDECELRMSDIRKIQDSVTKSLIAVYHGRIRYPGEEVRSA